MQNSHPKITVLIPTFNRAEYLAECLDSILSQTLPAAQIIVVNDGSTDHTRSVCEPYNKAIEYLELNQVGKSSAINYGLKRALGDYIWIFDDDDVALPDALARFVEPLEINPEYGFSYSTFFYTDTNENGRLGSVQQTLQIPDLEKRGFLIPLLERNFLGGAALFVRASCYSCVGHFDPELLRSQDYEMAIRIARRFKGIRVSGGPTFHYRQHEGTRGQSSDRFSSLVRLPKWLSYNQKFFRKFYHQVPLAEYLPPGIRIENKIRQAYLQRMAIMASKLLISEVTADLRALARLTDQTPLSKNEYLIIREMITRTAYQERGAIFDHFEFFNEIRQLSVASPVIRLLRAKILRALLARYRKHPHLSRLPGILCRIFRLYF